jgi:hypothetical protein
MTGDPMHALLEPLSTGDIIDRSIRIYRQNLKALLATAAGPFLLGAAAWLSMQLGSQIVFSERAEPSAAAGAGAVALFAFGVIAYVAYLFLMVLVYAGLGRVVGDHLMLGSAISARAVFRVVADRLRDLVVTALLMFVAGAVLVGIITFVLFVTTMILALLVAALAAFASSVLPEWAVGILLVVVFVVVFGGIVLVLVPVMLSRVVFVPHVVVIEGASVGSAFGRAFALGAKNWNRVLAVLLFTYCTGLSLTMAAMAPLVLALWLGGYLSSDSLTLVDSIYGAAGQFANFLSVPAWSIAYTIMYFDSRVRGEGYDVELLVRKLPQPLRPVYVVPAGAAAPGAPRLESRGGRCPGCGQFLLTDPLACRMCGWRARA